MAEVITTDPPKQTITKTPLFNEPTSTTTGVETSVNIFNFILFVQYNNLGRVVSI